MMKRKKEKKAAEKTEICSKKKIFHHSSVEKKNISESRKCQLLQKRAFYVKYEEKKVILSGKNLRPKKKFGFFYVNDSCWIACLTCCALSSCVDMQMYLIQKKLLSFVRAKNH